MEAEQHAQAFVSSFFQKIEAEERSSSSRVQASEESMPSRGQENRGVSDKAVVRITPGQSWAGATEECGSPETSELDDSGLS